MLAKVPSVVCDQLVLTSHMEGLFSPEQMTQFDFGAPPFLCDWELPCALKLFGSLGLYPQQHTLLPAVIL